MSNVSVEKIGSRWIAHCSYEQRAIPKAAGFRWDPSSKCWYTTDERTALKLTPDGQAQLAAANEREQARRAEAVEASRAQDVAVELPCPEGLAYLPYQRAGIATALRRPNVLFGDEMGLGKTIQAIGVINTDATLKKILIVCPASLKLNWRRELRKWLTRDLSIAIAAGDSFHPDYADITIMNYDILAKHRTRLRAVAWDLIICDEAHYLKNPKAKRTQAIVGTEKKGQQETPPIAARRRIMLTGTPIPNRPVEGWSIFHYLDPEEFRSFRSYAKRFCDAQNNGYGWDMTGSSNLGELQEKLRASIMIRRLKADVLTELPAKRRSIIELPANGASGAVAAETKAYEANEERLAELRAAVEIAKASDDPEEFKAAVERLRQAASAAFTEMSKLRHATAVAKLPYVIDYVRDLVGHGRKVVVFAHHKDVIDALAADLGPIAVKLYGDTPMEERQANVDRFQCDAGCLVFIGGIMAAGVGLTLTAAAHVVFAELDWVPGNITQAEDRCHRIGQRDMVLVEHLVLNGSLDAKMAKTLVEKQEVIAAALDGATADWQPEALPILPTSEPATVGLSRPEIARQAAQLEPGQVVAIQEGLAELAAMDEDHASKENGVGFSKADSALGHRLASLRLLSPKQAVLGAKLVNRYRRQIGADIVARALAEAQSVLI